jgi:hypothetical protein
VELLDWTRYDAAAVTVSVLIAFSLVPLVHGMIETIGEYQQVNALLTEGLVVSLVDEDIDSGDHGRVAYTSRTPKIISGTGMLNAGEICIASSNHWGNSD